MTIYVFKIKDSLRCKNYNGTPSCGIKWPSSLALIRNALSDSRSACFHPKGCALDMEVAEERVICHYSTQCHLKTHSIRVAIITYIYHGTWILKKAVCIYYNIFWPQWRFQIKNILFLPYCWWKKTLHRLFNFYTSFKTISVITSGTRCFFHQRYDC